MEYGGPYLKTGVTQSSLSFPLSVPRVIPSSTSRVPSDRSGGYGCGAVGVKRGDIRLSRWRVQIPTLLSISSSLINPRPKTLIGK